MHRKWIWRTALVACAAVLGTIAGLGDASASGGVSRAVLADSGGVSRNSTSSPFVRSAPELRADLDEILADPRLREAGVGVTVSSAEAAEPLYTRNAHQGRTPASNAKLATTAAALDALGPDYRFGTSVRTDGDEAEGVLRGNLYLRGTGDPTIRAADYDRIAAEIADSGVRQVAGTLIADDTWFDAQRHGKGWLHADWGEYYAAPISALTVAANSDYDAGSVRIRTLPGSRGEPARVDTAPRTSTVQLVNRTRTVASGADTTISAHRAADSADVVVTGDIAADADVQESLVSVPDATAYATDVFHRALRAHGVRVTDVERGPTPPGAREIARHDSMPLNELLAPLLKLSNNGHAEVLTKAMGRVVREEGSWRAGLEVVRNRLAKFGVPVSGARLVDGSGLSELNTLAPTQLTALLRSAREQPWYRSWRAALPVAGRSERMVGGTLRDRMGDTAAEGAVRAKTGSLTGVTALSGYVTAADGQELVFAVLLNDVPTDADLSDVEDAVAVRLATYDGRRDRQGAAPSEAEWLPSTSAMRPLGKAEPTESAAAVR